MKALIYRDWCMLKKSIFYGILCMLVACCIGIITMLGITKGNFRIDDEPQLTQMIVNIVWVIMAMLSILLTLFCCNIKDMDDKSGWYRVLYSSPIALWKELASRYVMLIISNTFFTVLYAVMQLIIMLSGGFTYGIEEMKTVAYVWLIGFILICLRLPTDILLSSKESTAVSVVFSTFLIIVFMILMMASDSDMEFYSKVADWLKFLHQHCVIIVIGLGAVSYTATYLCKRNHRWVR